MTETARYQFLPVARRGLAAAVGVAGGSPPRRGTVRVAVSVSNVAAPITANVTVHGPGDVLGLDPRLIVRTVPGRYVLDHEPNVLAAVDFDPPDLPWMLTPAQADGQGRLRPWLVLVVVEQREGVSIRVDRGRPLPVLSIDHGAERELPSLAESWAWAHAQVLAQDASEATLRSALDDRPLVNVSRIVCPRRLAPSTRYYACLVPAFSAGVERGLGQPVPLPAAGQAEPALQDAWGPSATAVTLPVYHHWEFGTGPDGDFESLARRLSPFAAPATVGTTPMFVGEAGSGMPSVPASDPGAVLPMDGALRAPIVGNGRLEEVAQAVQDGLRTALDAPQDLVATGAAGAPPVGPPIYGAWHARRHSVPDDGPAWLRELCLDPRSRVAGGLGAECVRQVQELLMDAAWEQVGDVLAANAALNRARFALEAARRLHARHVRPLPHDRLLQLTAPLHGRVLLATETVRTAIGTSSLPDASVAPALRRLASPTRPLVRKAVRELGLADAVTGLGALGVLDTMAGRRDLLDPVRPTLDGVNQFDSLRGIDAGSGTVAIPFTELRVSRERIAPLLDQFAQPLEPAPVVLTPRPDLRTAGLLTELHLGQLLELAPGRRGAGGEGEGEVAGGPPPLLVSDALRRLSAASASNPGAAGFLLEVEGARSAVRALDVATDGRVLVRAAEAERDVLVGRLDPRLAGRGRAGGVISGLPPGTLRTTATRPADVRVTDTGTISIRRGGGGPAAAAPVRSNTIASPVVDAAVLARFDTALVNLATVDRAIVEPVSTFVAFPVAQAAATLLARTDPDLVVPARTRTLVRIGNVSFAEAALVGSRLVAGELLDRVMAYPDLQLPMYGVLRDLDPGRFLPGVAAIPPDTVSLLETNPRFVAAFLAGANHEMNRELLWRGYPTDQRGTPLRRFWDRLDDGPDIDPIDRWRSDRELARQPVGSSEGTIVLLVRGELLRRYPGTVVYAVRADAANPNRLSPTPTDLRRPILTGTLEPDMTFVGFDLTTAELEAGAWFFVLQEQPTEPRFGLDVSAARDSTGTWADMTWDQAGVVPGGHLPVASGPLANLNRRLTDDIPTDGSATFGTNAAHVAAALFQQPVKVAVAARHMLATGS